ncbi:MAG: hypothetical protein IIB38_10350 [Candidatus Hydrogenedentes bacterium]|nr:hypothetical protein [Candidatus Hydrogenedentota bacterium]
MAEWVLPFRDATARVSGRPAHAEEEADAPEKRSKLKRYNYSRTKVRENVRLKKLAVVEEMDRRDFVRVGNLAEELISYHFDYGGAKFACMSLCDLATDAKQRGLSRLQLELATRSVDLGPADAWSLRQLGDALLVNGRLKDAMRVYDSAISIDGHEVAMKGRAETFDDGVTSDHS